MKKHLTTHIKWDEAKCAMARMAGMKSPYPVSVDGFLSKEECCDIRNELRFVLWRPSLIRHKEDDGAYRDVLKIRFRASETATYDWFTEQLKGKLTQIEKRLHDLVAFDSACLESWQATAYAHDGFLAYHLDSGYWEDHPAGDRVLTFLIYLTTPQKGGGTHFRALDISIPAKVGRLVVWNNLFPEGGADHRMIHSGEPLIKGEKITLVAWVRQRPFPNS